MRSDPDLEQKLEALLRVDRPHESRAPGLRGGQGRKPPASLPPSGGGGTFDNMEHRVTRLEADMHYVRRDLDAINGKLDKLIDRTSDLPSKADLTTFRWQWIATAAAAIALIVGGIIGGLSWIAPDAVTPTPIVIQTAGTPATSVARATSRP